MKIADVFFAPGLRLTNERSAQERVASQRNVRGLLAQSTYLFATISAMIGWIWLLTSIGFELFYS
jgi:hypothetical protein